MQMFCAVCVQCLIHMLCDGQRLTFDVSQKFRIAVFPLIVVKMGKKKNAAIVQLVLGILSLVTGLVIMFCYLLFPADGLAADERAIYTAYVASPIYCSICPIMAAIIGVCAGKTGTTCNSIWVVIFSILSIASGAVQIAMCAVFGAVMGGLGDQSKSEVRGITIGLFCGMGLGLFSFFTALAYISITCCCPGDSLPENYAEVRLNVKELLANKTKVGQTN